MYSNMRGSVTVQRQHERDWRRSVCPYSSPPPRRNGHAMTAVPDVKITLSLPGAEPADVTLAYPLPAEHHGLLLDLFTAGDLKGVIECRMHDDDPALRDLRDADGRVRGAWLYLARFPGTRDRLLLKHWPGGPVTGSHAVPSPMTTEHRRRQEYVALRGQAAGYEVELEKSLARGTVSDVVVRGTAVLAAEVQQTGIALSKVIRRDQRTVTAGAAPVWFSDLRDPHYAFRVAHVETNVRDGMSPRTWRVVTGTRQLERERCTPSSRWNQCPNTGRSWCGGWHGLWVPKHGLVVDDVVEQVPAGALVRLDTGTRQGVVLVTPPDRDEWMHSYAPAPKQAVRARRDAVVERTSTWHADYSAEKLRRRIATERPQAPTGQLCTNCRAMPPGYNSTICTRCFFFPEKFRVSDGEL